MIYGEFQIGDEVRSKLPHIWEGIGVVKKVQTDLNSGIIVITVQFLKDKAVMSTVYFTKVSKLEKALK